MSNIRLIFKEITAIQKKRDACGNSKMPSGLKRYHMKRYKTLIKKLESKYLINIQNLISKKVTRFYCIENYETLGSVRHVILLYGKNKGDFIGFHYPFANC